MDNKTKLTPKKAVEWKAIAKNLATNQRLTIYLIKKLVELKVISEDDAFSIIGDGLREL